MPPINTHTHTYLYIQTPIHTLSPTVWRIRWFIHPRDAHRMPPINTHTHTYLYIQTPIHTLSPTVWRIRWFLHPRDAHRVPPGTRGSLCNRQRRSEIPRGTCLLPQGVHRRAYTHVSCRELDEKMRWSEDLV